jgi:cyclin A
MKRGSSYDNTSASTAISGPQPKRRTVLRDVTNLRNANSNKTFAAAPKVQVLRCSLHNCIIVQ